MNNLTKNDFKKMHGYLSYEIDELEITIEQCGSGYDVGIYKNGFLIEPKVCTDIEMGGISIFDREERRRALRFAFTRALVFANRLLKKYYKFKYGSRKTTVYNKRTRSNS